MSDDNGTERWLYEKEAAPYIGTTYETLRKWVQRGDAPPHVIHPNGRRVYNRAELDEWLDARKVG